MIAKIIEFLRKMGILQIGAKSATYTSAKDMPDTFLNDEIPDKVREEANKQTPTPLA